MNISVNELSLSIGDKKILKDINISVENKEIVGIIGPNGSGKSTLLKCIYRVLQQDRGIVMIDGEDIRNFPVRETAKRMAVVAQHNETSFDFTVMEMVLLGRSPHKKFMERDNEDDYKLAFDALEKVGMLEFKDRSLSSLSGGEKQRIVLARALVQDTECLILDEPTNHLDIRYQLQFMSIAKELNVTVISAIHDLNIAAMYCDKIFALKDGKIIAYGTPKEVITSEIIESLYNVKSKLIFGEDGEMSILFKKM